MLYLTGSKNNKHSAYYEDGVIGVLTTPRNRYEMGGIKVWAVDNGCFTGSYPGDDEYLRFLEKHAAHADRCLFACAPDVLGDAESTLALLPGMTGRIRALGYEVALVGQDGMENLEVPWDLADWLFVGGSTEWKLGPGAAALIKQAIARGKRVHIGRVNSRKRYEKFRALGAHSADGTFLAFGPDVNLPRLLEWIRSPQQLELFSGSGE